MDKKEKEEKQKDEKLGYCILSLLANDTVFFNFSQESIQQLFKSNNLNFDKELYEYYRSGLKEFDPELDSIISGTYQGPAVKLEAVSDTEGSEKEEKEKKVEPEETTDFSAFF